MKNNIENRAKTVLNLKQFSKINKPEKVLEYNLDNIPEMYVLRMLIKKPHEDFQIPDELEFCKPLIKHSFNNQLKMNIRKPFCYITIRSGLVQSIDDDVFHVDGFSMRNSITPEQNYIWCNNSPTEYVKQKIDFPSDFDPLIYNVHKFIQSKVKIKNIKTIKPNNMYCIDPYVIHRRPFIKDDIKRCFIRISYTSLEIDDKNNTLNPLIETNYKRDGIKFRESLLTYSNSMVTIVDKLTKNIVR